MSHAAELQGITDARISKRTRELNDDDQTAIYRHTDGLFAWLMLLQWFAAVAAALWLSPRTWAGTNSEIHIHVWAAFVLGGTIAALPIYLALRHPGRLVTRLVIAAAQMLMSALLIHLTGGRIETHFHVFGSLALLAVYRDWQVLALATIVVTADHAIRGVYWPQSVYGIQYADSWRFFEHAGWVVFEDVFLFITMRQSRKEMWRIAEQRATLENTNSLVEAKVVRRTEALTAMQCQLEDLVAELQTKNQELDEFSYVASHDLQEPVRKLISFSKLLEEDLGDDLNDLAKKDLGYIVDAASRMRSLIQDLLALSRAGRTAMRHDACSLDKCVDHVLSILSERIAESNARITRDPLPTVIGDESMLVQLCQNLISNALKFVEKDHPEIHITAKVDGDKCTLGVRDNGIGIRSEYFDKIFKPFQRLHGRNEFDGTGIGLAICRKTVERHGGQLWIESRLGEGSHFQFTLKVAMQPNGNSCVIPPTKRNEPSYCS